MNIVVWNITIITTSGGGVLISNISNKIEKVRLVNLSPEIELNIISTLELGYNYRMSNVVAGIGRGQLKILIKELWEISLTYKKG